ncbi:MAG: arylsulfatase [Planctomycetota bacterium]
MCPALPRRGRLSFEKTETTRLTLRGLWLIAVLLVGVSTHGKPSVVVIMADDQGWGDLSGHGNTNLRTPHLDRLASEGATFERFYVQPVCAPTRAELLTGRYHPRVGVSGVSEGRERLDPGVPTFADVFRSAGYATAAFGKWHNGTQAPYHPLCRGFDEFYGFTSGHWGHYFGFWLDRNGSIVHGDGYTTDDFTSEAISFIVRHRDEPFVAYVAYNTPHSPMQVPDATWDANRAIRLRGTNAAEENIDHTRTALAMVENIDDNVGRLLTRLDELGVANNTIVVYLSDNGPNGHRWTGGLRGKKGSPDEGGVRSPLMIRWPGKVDAGRMIAGNAAVLDLLPTLAELAGVDLANAEELDGISHAARLLAGGGPVPTRQLFSHWGGRTAVREGDRMLDAEGRLYDLSVDPGQQRDLAPERPEVASRLADAVREWRIEMGIEAPPSMSPFTVGHPSMAITQLPARDATGHGAVRRSNQYPNCSYFDAWQTKDDRIDWSVDVVKPGRYEAHIYLGVPTTSVGGEVSLRSDDATVIAELIQATDTTLLGHALDRVRRKEGDVMDFQPISLGRIELSAGKQTLSVTATPDTTGRGPAVWLLTLTRAP